MNTTALNTLQSTVNKHTQSHNKVSDQQLRQFLDSGAESPGSLSKAAVTELMKLYQAGESRFDSPALHQQLFDALVKNGASEAELGAKTLRADASTVGATTQVANLRLMGVGSNVKVNFVPADCGGDPQHDFDNNAIAARFFEHQKPELFAIMKKMIDNVNSLVGASGFETPDTVDLEFYSIFNRQAAAYFNYGVLAGLPFDEFLDYTKDLTPDEFAALDPEMQADIKREYGTTNDGDRIKLPICFSHSDEPEALRDLLMKDGLASREEFVLEGYEWAPNDRIDDEKCRNVNPQDLERAIRPAAGDSGTVYYDSAIFKSIAAHEYGHILLNENLLYPTLKQLKFSEFVDGKAALTGANKYETSFSEMMTQLKADPEIQALLKSAKQITDTHLNNDQPYTAVEAKELESIREAMRANPLVKAIREEVYSKPTFGDLLTSYNEFFADFLSVMFDSIDGEVPLGETGIAAFQALEDPERKNYRSFNDNNLAKSLDQCHLAEEGAWINQRDPHNLISFPRLFIKPYIEAAETMEQKQALMAKVTASVKEVLQNRIESDVIGIDYDLMYGMSPRQGDDPTLLYDCKPTRDVNSEILEALKKNLGGL